MKKGSLFCFVCTYEIHRTGLLQITFLVFLEEQGGASAWFHGVWSCGVEVFEY
jgi:hypothetical protein